eukprot:4908513-Amphidinium_carterae.1
MISSCNDRAKVQPKRDFWRSAKSRNQVFTAWWQCPSDEVHKLAMDQAAVTSARVCQCRGKGPYV